MTFDNPRPPIQAFRNAVIRDLTGRLLKAQHYFTCRLNHPDASVVDLGLLHSDPGNEEPTFQSVAST